MHIRIMVLAVAALCAAPVTLAAQGPPARGDTFNLARAVAVARVANPRVTSAAAGVAAATARIRPAGALPDPTLTLGAMNYMLPSLSAARDPLSMNQVTLMQMLPVNGTLGLRRIAATRWCWRSSARRARATGTCTTPTGPSRSWIAR